MAKTKKVFGGRNKITPYNKFMKTELPKVKIDNPKISHKEAFKLVAQRWKDSPENPKNVQEPPAE
ncbi:hypothetical protein RhiirA5_412086 [Rhizophagus irregularis]|uniref:YABBY protein C-terminal domain-containing protein n=3 Tax=Rhizophagus irregularis TaxID=588596 RepID=U9V1K9_RHIID|nr:hypothetical protein GLOIN_2v1789741 [Rhizophagus irregularis DAOM 181602=DAOM 197198]EXX71509.1 hypothetical protein RirG_077920 [Rhizophagus irregularis DAOM 197198w]PKC12246.1 hypothetical protein RhiirA5_412086 [Rhizophagus irregularis]PKC62475.1 hypothetical protein RhiirA1_465112 [Rhizophagus irregularis]PKK69945.1 hypothetical protein RhiirC2_747466 [Rhizophagus irregularis]PKY25410.1 hypothetical protein RhiirB3_440327 [Rhizophagus irregularis]|eukprot:XP_025165812.1 hypothetical protein GLOIN_2v1789741 [Rhizophagus irregularis DAOM 181602=DAOM 197198]